MKIKAPFKMSYDGQYRLRCWGYGLGWLNHRFLGWGYNVAGGGINTLRSQIVAWVLAATREEQLQP